MNIQEYSRQYEELMERTNESIDDAEKCGNDEEIIRIMREDIYVLIFAQNQYLRRVYEIVKNFYDKLSKTDSEKAGKVFDYLKNLENSIHKTNNQLENWDNIVDNIISSKHLEEILGE